MATIAQQPVETSRSRRRPAARGGGGGRSEDRVKSILYWLSAFLTVIVFVVPLLWFLMRSLQPGTVIAAPPDPSTFFDLSFDNFRGLRAQGDMFRAVGNSLIVALGTALLTTVLATMAGYGFGRFKFRGSGILFGLILLTLMVPFQAILTPLFIQLNEMRLTDSLLGLVLFYSTVNLAFGTFVMRTAFMSVPDGLEEAARIDGSGTIGTFFHVLFPLVMPGMATTALFAFLAAWTEFLGALVFITRQDLFTLPVALVNLQQGTYGQLDFGLLAAGSVTAMIPCVILFIALQRYYVAGLTAGSLKG
jgi:multiple sugar transport system permease protein